MYSRAVTSDPQDFAVTVPVNRPIKSLMMCGTWRYSYAGARPPATAVLLPPSDDEAMEDDSMMAEVGTIAEVATEAGTFGTLLTALTEAGLAGTFADAAAGPFTVFASTDEAFAALPEGTLETLLADPGGALTAILTYHVVEGAVKAETVVTLDSATPAATGSERTPRAERRRHRAAPAL